MRQENTIQRQRRKLELLAKLICDIDIRRDIVKINKKGSNGGDKRKRHKRKSSRNFWNFIVEPSIGLHELSTKRDFAREVAIKLKQI